MRVKISDGVREVEVEAEGENIGLADLEGLATRLYQTVSRGGGRGRPPTPVGFNGWSTLSDHERLPEE